MQLLRIAVLVGACWWAVRFGAWPLLALALGMVAARVVLLKQVASRRGRKRGSTMKTNPFDHELVWQIGPVLITRPVVTTWGVMAVMVAAVVVGHPAPVGGQARAAFKASPS